MMTRTVLPSTGKRMLAAACAAMLMGFTSADEDIFTQGEFFEVK